VQVPTRAQMVPFTVAAPGNCLEVTATNALQRTAGDS